jgi:hypothetical protein
MSSHTVGVKTSVSIPRPLFAEADALARRLGISRSESDGEVVSAALDAVYGTVESELNPTLNAAQRRALSSNAKVGDGGNVCIYTLAATHLIVDINAYYT